MSDLRKEEPQLSQEELVAVRRFIEEEARMRWLWHTIRKSSAWLAAVVGSVVLLWDHLIKVLRSMLGID